MIEEKDEDGKIDFKYNFKVYFELLKKYRIFVSVLIVMIFILESLNMAENYLFKYVVDKGTIFAAGHLVQSVFVKNLIIVAYVFLGLVILRTILKYLHMHLINRLDAYLITDIKRKFFNHILRLSYNFHTTHKTGSLISKLTRCGGAVEKLTDSFIFNLIPLVMKVFIVGFALLYFSKLASLIVFVTVICFILFSLFVQKKQMPSSVDKNETEDLEKAKVADYYANMDSIKYFGKEKSTSEKFETYIQNTSKLFIKNWDYFKTMDSGQALIIGFGSFLLLYVTISEFLAGTITIGGLVFIYVTFGDVVTPLFKFTWGIREFYQAMADFESLFKYGKIENEVKDLSNAKLAKITQGTIEIKNISFSYGKRKIFDNLSLKIPKNKKVAFVGHSGCGKTTLVKLLYRLYDVQTGEITIDGENIAKFHQESLRNEMSIVPQDCALFDDTIYNNIAFSNPTATRADVLGAIKFAQLDKIIEKFPHKEDTIVGERGVRLSGGEKQRVSIARAVLANKKILFLDEATSSLDSETESEIQKSLALLMKQRTAVIIAHRLSTIMKADVIVVMDKGTIVQMGNHKKLIAKDGIYKKLWQLQKGGYIKD